VITARAFSGKHYAVLGLARSGLATVEALLASGARVTAWDRREGPRAAIAGRAEVADLNEADLSRFDALVLSPGVPLNTHPLAAKAYAARVPIIGDIELFAQARAELPPHKVVGITGTNGKSTTTALVHHILKTAGIPSLMGGNIGLPILSQAPLPAGGVYVLELSSYQLDLTQSLDCDVAVLTNITPDHLDRYESFEAYAASKARLFKMQATGWAVIATDDPITQAIAAERAVHLLRVSMDDYRTWQRHWPTLQGPHNRQNAAAAIAAAKELGIGWPTIEPALATFPGLPHRMERLGEHDGVLFVNDSKATNPASTAPALAAYSPAPAIHGGTPRIHWICGGLPKSDELDECAPNFPNVAAAYTIGEAGPMFADLLAPHMHVERCEMLCEATRRAIVAARPGDVVLLSPACASFDQFRDYETRGDHFRRIVAALTGEATPEAVADLCPQQFAGRSAA
jgi:UDP-N-acetylmuramoylalanine--D-glutamate ligase